MPSLFIRQKTEIEFVQMGCGLFIRVTFSLDVIHCSTHPTPQQITSAATASHPNFGRAYVMGVCVSPEDVSNLGQVYIGLSAQRKPLPSLSFTRCIVPSLLFPTASCEGKSSELASASDGVLKDYRTITQIKQHLFAALQGINRGIFGEPSEKKSEIEGLVELLESQNPTPEPTLCLGKAAGRWKLIYSTIIILGSKRTKLGLRDFTTLGDFFQSIMLLSAKGLNLLSGQLTIDASFKIASKTRVDITYESVITPDQDVARPI